MLEEIYGKHVLVKHSVLNGLIALKMMILTSMMKIEGEELKTLLDQHFCQMQEQSAELLGVDGSTVAKCLQALKIIQKQGNWVS